MKDDNKQCTKKELTDFLGMPEEFNQIFDKGISVLLESINESLAEDTKQEQQKGDKKA